MILYSYLYLNKWEHIIASTIFWALKSSLLIVFVKFFINEWIFSWRKMSINICWLNSYPSLAWLIVFWKKYCKNKWKQTITIDIANIFDDFLNHNGKYLSRNTNNTVMFQFVLFFSLFFIAFLSLWIENKRHLTRFLMPAELTFELKAFYRKLHSTVFSR